MSNSSMKKITQSLLFLGSLFVIVLLIPRVSATGALLTGNDNYWISKNTNCPAYYLDSEFSSHDNH